MNNPSRTVAEAAEQRVTLHLGLFAKTDSPYHRMRTLPLFLFISHHIRPPGTPPSRVLPLASARPKRSNSLKPLSHHAPPTASHTGEHGDATAPQLEPSAPPSSSLPLPVSNLREGQAVGLLERQRACNFIRFVSCKLLTFSDSAF